MHKNSSLSLAAAEGIAVEREPPSAAALADLLERLAEDLGLHLDRAAARQALERERLAARSVDWHALAGRAATPLGLELRRVEVSPAEIARGAARAELPIATLRDDHGWVVVVRGGGGRVRVETPEGARWLRPEGLARMLGRGGAASPVPWVVASPRFPAHPLSGHGDSPSPLRRLLALLRLEREHVGIAVIYAAAVGVVSLAVPIGVQALVGSVAFGGLLQPVLVLSLLVLGALVFAAVLRAMQAWVIERIQQRVFARVAVDLAHRLPRVRAEAFDREHGPELVNRFFDVLTVQKGAALLLVDGVAVALQTLVGILLLLVYHPVLLAFDVIVVVTAGTAIFLLGRGAQATSIKESKAKYRTAAWLEEIVRHPATFRSSGAAAFAAGRAKDLTRDYLGARRKHFAVVFRQTIAALAIQALAGGSLLAIGGWLVLDGKLTLGQLVAAELLLTATLSGLAKLGKQLESFYDVLASSDKLGHLLDLPVEPFRQGELPEPAPGPVLRLRDVSYRYAGGASVLAGVTLEIPRRGRVAVVGRNGAGKSTLADVACALREATEGRVELEGVDLRDLSAAEAREAVVLVRDVEIFEGTVAENVHVGRGHVTDADVRAALRAVGLEEAISALPEGIHTAVTTGGPTFSRGQARLLMIARAIVGKPRVIVVDEILAGLDPGAAEAAERALTAEDAPWAVVATSPSGALLRRCDTVLTLDGGSLQPARAEDLASAGAERVTHGH